MWGTLPVHSRAFSLKSLYEPSVKTGVGVVGTSRLAGFFVVLLATSAAAQSIERNVVYGMISGTALLLDVHQPTVSNGFGVLYLGRWLGVGTGVFRDRIERNRAYSAGDRLLRRDRLRMLACRDEAHPA